ncbi:MAG: hypothetical protein PF517_16410 [Salinivirgaceae bacterium]|jgi:hypothetical protein|nr:hypothetical protein [Salinivirgaceae bacterium]
MIELKPLDIAHRFCQRLIMESTGTRTELADYLGISPCMVNTYKNKIEYLYKINIYYSRKRCTYFINDNDKVKLPPI